MMTTKKRTDIRHEPFVADFLKRIPGCERDSFTDSQLECLKVAFGTRAWGVHPVDLRWTLKVWKKRYYFVFVAGVNRRPLSRRQQEIALLGKSIMLAVVLIISTLLGVLILYLLKSAVGIDIFPNFSFGVWDWFNKNYFQ